LLAKYFNYFFAPSIVVVELTAGAASELVETAAATGGNPINFLSVPKGPFSNIIIKFPLGFAMKK
jgi:hypothetical protein